MIPPFEIEVEANEYEKLPEKQGIYFFFDSEGELLYIGKTNNLLMRMKNHFSSPHSGHLAKYKDKIQKIAFFTAEDPKEKQEKIPLPELYTVAQVAEILRMKPYKVRKLLKEKKLKGFQLPGGQWRISEDQIKKFLNRRTTECIWREEKEAQKY